MDETPKGWYVQYIDRDPETIRRQEELEKKKKQEMDDEERSAKFIEEQVRRGQEGKEPEVCLCAEKKMFSFFSPAQTFTVYVSTGRTSVHRTEANEWGWESSF